jgi:methyl-accepting chemotaxis protein
MHRLTRWTKSLSIAYKLALIGLAFLLPIAMLLYFTISGINTSIRFSQLELYGDRLLQPIGALSIDLPRHERLLDQPSASAELMDTTSRIDQSFESLRIALNDVGEPLKITTEGLQAAGMSDLRPDSLLVQWNELRDRGRQLSSEERPLRYRDLTEKLHRLFRRVGDTSNLILDPDLDSYYLMDIAVVGLPQSQARLNDILAIGNRLSRKPKLKNEDQFALSSYAAALRNTDYPRIDVGLSTAVREDANFYGTSPSLQANIPPLKKAYLNELTQLSSTLDRLSRKSNRETIAEVINQGTDLLTTSETLHSSVSRELMLLLQNRVQSYQKQRITYLLLSLLAIALAIAMIYRISTSINRRLKQLIVIAESIASGDLTVPVEIDSSDELGQLLLSNRLMVDNLNSLISQMQQSGIQVSSVATQLSATTKEQEATIQEQAQSTSYILQSLGQVSTLTEQLANSMDDVLRLSAATAAAANKGQTDLVHMSQSMAVMDRASGSISSRLQAINEKADNITSVVTTITKVADQTNLLSLNASIEAEKAGEYGRGFAVVAREIRRLADQTAVATLEIERMVKEMQSAVTAGVMEMDNFIDKVRNSVTDVARIGGQLDEITSQVQDITTNYEGVNQTMRQQADSSHQVNEAMTNLDEGMRQTTEALRDTYGAIAQLTDAAGGLRQQVSRFKVNGDDRSGALGAIAGHHHKK